MMNYRTSVKIVIHVILFLWLQLFLGIIISHNMFNQHLYRIMISDVQTSVPPVDRYYLLDCRLRRLSLQLTDITYQIVYYTAVLSSSNLLCSLIWLVFILLKYLIWLIYIIYFILFFFVCKNQTSKTANNHSYLNNFTLFCHTGHFTYNLICLLIIFILKLTSSFIKMIWTPYFMSVLF